MLKLKTCTIKGLNAYFYEYAGRMPTTKEITYMRNHKEARVLTKPTVKVEKAIRHKKNESDWNTQEIKMFRSEKRALEVIKYHTDPLNELKMPISDEMRAIVSKHLPENLKHLLAQI